MDAPEAVGLSLPVRKPVHKPDNIAAILLQGPIDPLELADVSADTLDVPLVDARTRAIGSIRDAKHEPGVRQSEGSVEGILA
jgi:hypothetical protein